MLPLLLVFVVIVAKFFSPTYEGIATPPTNTLSLVESVDANMSTGTDEMELNSESVPSIACESNKPIASGCCCGISSYRSAVEFDEIMAAVSAFLAMLQM